MLNDYLLTIVQFVGMVQCLFIATALLYLPGSHRSASGWLSALFVVWMLMFGFMALRQNDLEPLVPVLSFLRLPLFFLCGPLLYLYLRQITQPWTLVNLRGAAPHFAMFTIVLLAYLPALVLSHEALVETLFRRPSIEGAGVVAVQRWLLTITRFVLQLFVLHLLFYVVSCLRVLARHKQRVR